MVNCVDIIVVNEVVEGAPGGVFSLHPDMFLASVAALPAGIRKQDFFQKPKTDRCNGLRGGYCCWSAWAMALLMVASPSWFHPLNSTRMIPSLLRRK